ncbi:MULTISPECIES: ABC transporter substrate-binding protein [unclassified Devosia]|uniref:ABC transporter substrate-binding protein n=1 Tax=unclassified Devosia TaxID=196773 RepID=UPI00086F6FB3|nr:MULTISPECIES: ABC transporter substrate-binding protein [unclassified Devosia]MBN9363689.1 carbohydrate ABC transporter substrate-binding protein [Devosia sp.]ODS84620.1 MAG: ABC transporter substrate-binding protein [Devosia sp. SCN 66-27]OJX27645.1 MAG: ABC transporter substrate-binding protein [Devosia sp. 66-14]
MRNLTRAALATTGIVVILAGAASAQDKVKLTFLFDNAPSTVAMAEALATAFEAKNPNIEIETESRPGGADGDNLIKTRLATSEMSDVFLYNSGSLFQAINPTQNLVDLSAEPFQANVIDSFKTVVTGTDGKVYGAPIGTAMGGGIFYNIPIYKELGLTPPKSWAEFMANNEKIKAAGKTAVIQTFGATWTSQLFVLGDFYNVLAADPNFATDYTAGKAKYASTPAALKGFERQEEVFKAGLLNEDFAAATFEDGVTKVATGEGAHYPMLSFAVANIKELAPENINDVGFFAIPGDDAAKNGLTTWMPAGLYIPKTTKHEAEAKQFIAFVASVEGCDIQTQSAGATGPYLVKGCTLPADVPPAVADLLPYFQEGGHSAPALEFLSPIKGPALEQITVEVGSGIRDAASGAALYDEDVKKQAQQLGLPGW